MIPLIDSTKTTGLVFFPGTMVGMLLAGADPIDAVRLQLILLWTLMGSVAIVGADRRRRSATAASSRPRTSSGSSPSDARRSLRRRRLMPEPTATAA